MNLKITISTLEEMTGHRFENNKMGFANEIKQHGLLCSAKTVVRALENDTISEFISIPVLISMCKEYDYPFYRCFTFYNMSGIEKPHTMTVLERTNEKIRTNLLNLASDLCNMYPRMSMVKSDMGFELDFLELADENIKALNDIPATVFIETLMSKHMDINNYIRQGTFKVPYQSETPIGMVAEDPHPNKEHKYLSAYINLRIMIRDANNDFDDRFQMISDRGQEMIQEKLDLRSAIFELLAQVSRLLKPFPESLFKHK